MIQIQQDMPNLNGLESIINKNGEVQIAIDIDSVRLDIENMEEKIKTAFSKTDKKNMTAIKKYLEKMLSRTKDGVLEILWSTEEDVLKTYPIDITHIIEASIEMTDYISEENGHLVRVDYRDVLEIIAIEMMYRDLGETFNGMEEKLSDIGITGIYPSSKLLKHFDCDAIALSKLFKIEDSAYYVKNANVVYEYFGKKEFKTTRYKEPVEYSVKHALAILTQAILSRLGASNIPYKLCSVSDSGIYFITNSDVDIDKILNESAVVRAFGRRFEVKPKVTIY